MSGHDDNHFRDTSCLGKQKYEYGPAAAKAKDHLKSKKAKRGGLSVYRCHFCEYWHLGRPGKLAAPKRRRKIRLTL